VVVGLPAVIAELRAFKVIVEPTPGAAKNIA